MTRLRPYAATLAGLFLLATALTAAEQPTSGTNQPDGAAIKERYAKFTEQMLNTKLVGQFTVTGKDDRPPSKEEYTIHKVEKLPEGDTWLFHSRIKYGKHDLAIPLPIDVKWAGDTPVLTVDNLTIPGMGTFSSRVVLHDQKYAGTWRHDEVSGHLFGTIEKIAE